MVKSSTTEEKVLERWKEHFYEILDVSCEETDLPERCQLDYCEESTEMDTGSNKRAISCLV